MDTKTKKKLCEYPDCTNEVSENQHLCLPHIIAILAEEAREKKKARAIKGEMQCPKCHFKIPKNHAKILYLLANNPEICQYQIPKMLSISYRHASRILHLLEKNDFVTIIRTEPSSKSGKDKIILGLTEEGLSFVRDCIG